jgi:hypothetical protein
LELSFLVMKLAVMTGPEECGVLREYGEDADGEVGGLDARGKKYGESEVEGADEGEDRAG